MDTRQWTEVKVLVVGWESVDQSMHNIIQACPPKNTPADSPEIQGLLLIGLPPHARTRLLRCYRCLSQMPSRQNTKYTNNKKIQPPLQLGDLSRHLPCQVTDSGTQSKSGGDPGAGEQVAETHE